MNKTDEAGGVGTLVDMVLAGPGCRNGLGADPICGRVGEQIVDEICVLRD